jgi:hypothetical protein
MMTTIFVVSVLSWRYIETPFRIKRWLRNERSLLAASALASITIVAFGVVLANSEGLPGRSKHTLAVDLDVRDEEWIHWGTCEQLSNKLNKKAEPCEIGAHGKPPRFFVWGDSHARALASGIEKSAKNVGINGLIAIQSACPPLISIDRPRRLTCSTFNESVLEMIAERPDISTVILVARWGLSTNGTRYKLESGSSVRLVNVNSSATGTLTNPELFEIGLNNTVDELERLGRNIVLVNSIPEIGHHVPSALFVSRVTGREVEHIISPSVDEFMERNKEVEIVFETISSRRSIRVLDPAASLCGETRCGVTAGGIPLYRDDDHLSTFGSKYIAAIFDKVFKTIENRDALPPF